MNIIERIKTDQFFTHEYVLLEDDAFIDEFSKSKIKHFSKFLPPRWLDNEILKNRIVYCFQLFDISNKGRTFRTHILDERTKQTDLMIKSIVEFEFDSRILSRMLLHTFISSIENDSQVLTKIIMENGGGIHQMGYSISKFEFRPRTHPIHPI
jgi:hypothetical protein